MPNTPNASLPYPALGSVPNVPSDIQSLATALDTKVPGSFASAGSRNSAIGSPTDGVPAYRTDLHAPEYYHSGVGAWAHNWCLLSETNISSPQSSITLPAPPQDFRDLRITASLRDTTNVNSYYNWSLRFNGDSGTNYAIMMLFNNNFAASFSTSASSGNTSTANCFLAAGAAAGSNVFGHAVVDIPFYSRGGVEKVGLFQASVWNGGAVGAAQQGSFVWGNSAAITAITVVPTGGTSINTGSIFRVYGIG